MNGSSLTSCVPPSPPATKIGDQLCALAYRRKLAMTSASSGSWAAITAGAPRSWSERSRKRSLPLVSRSPKISSSPTVQTHGDVAVSSAVGVGAVGGVVASRRSGAEVLRREAAAEGRGEGVTRRAR